MHSNFIKLMVIIPLFLTLQACTGLGMATTAGVVGGTAAFSENGVKQTAIDTRIRLEINDLWFKYDTDAFLKLNLTVEQGRVLVTGVVQNPDQRVEAIRLAWQPKDVSQVINEIRVEEGDGISGYARDAFISTNLRRKLIFNSDIKSINYSIDTVKATVFIMGIAQDQDELNAVIALARDTNYVQQVISYVKIKGNEAMQLQDPAYEATQTSATYETSYQTYDNGDGY